MPLSFTHMLFCPQSAEHLNEREKPLLFQSSEAIVYILFAHFTASITAANEQILSIVRYYPADQLHAKNSEKKTIQEVRLTAFCRNI